FDTVSRLGSKRDTLGDRATLSFAFIWHLLNFFQFLRMQGSDSTLKVLSDPYLAPFARIIPALLIRKFHVNCGRWRRGGKCDVSGDSGTPKYGCHAPDA